MWAVLIQKIDCLEDTVAQVILDNQQELLKVWNHHQIGDDLHSKWKESKVLQELENLLSGLDSAYDLNPKRKREQEDEVELDTTVINASLNSVLTPQFRIQNLSQGIGGSHEQRTTPVKANGLQIIQLPATSSEMLNCYMTYTHCWFPILDRPYVLKKCYEYRRSQNMGSKSTADLALLWAIFTYTSQQVGSSERPASQNDTQVDQRSPDQMYTISQSLIPSEPDRFEIGHLQALLILVLYDIGTGNFSKAWMLIGLAVRMTIELSQNKALRKQITATFHGCFILDTIVAFKLDRTPHLRRPEVETFGFVHEDGYEEWEPWMDISDKREPSFSISCFNKLTQLFLVLNDCITSQEKSIDLRRTFFDNAVRELGTLEQSYPFSMSTMDTRPPHQVFLQLCHLCLLSYITHQNRAAASTMVLRLLMAISSVLDRCINTAIIGMPKLSPIFGPLLLNLSHCFLRDQVAYPDAFDVATSKALAERLLESVTQSSFVWPCFNESVRILQQILATLTMSNGSSIGAFEPVKRRKTNDVDIYSLSSTGADAWTGNSYASGAPIIPQAMNAMPTPQSWNENLSYPLPPPSENIVMAEATPTAGTSSYQGIDLSSTDGFERGNIHAPMTSPSSHGDEIDALFHEMAHLDTTEWQNGRSQGLKDFGFTDDITFEAFCNDPERLLPMDGTILPEQGTLGNSQLWSMTNQPDSQPRGPNSAYDLLGPSWNR